ncbi:EAL domain-containing protein, partial [Thiolapillus sp.]|uniref:EAL domain-containing protein n=1 Tax=Thiolapillus sp. TaxID=2017437 RepID=UPI003AF57CF8
MPPNEFIPIAEETGVITEIGAWVIHQACKQLRAWKDQGYDPVPVAVNVSARQFVDKDLVKLIKEELSAFGLDPGLLELELTERVIMRSLEETGVKLQALKEVGVKLSVDDFGTGYSSMNYLKRFPLDALKIDRSFVMDLVTDSNDERCQPWRAKRRLVDPSSREAALFSRRALRQRENKVGLRTR